MVVVAAYDPGTDSAEEVDGRRLLYGQQAARAAMTKSVRELTSERIRDIEQVIVAAEPAAALLQVADRNPASLIVVGNRGLGAQEGEVLGSVPREIVQHAASDVLIVQTSALREEL
jgi:maltose/moltooligosaccharide transporter